MGGGETGFRPGRTNGLRKLETATLCSVKAVTAQLYFLKTVSKLKI